MGKKEIYEVYHSGRELQVKAIDSSDFTYKTIIKIVDGLDLKKKRVLDIGCGVGTIDFYMRKHGAKVTGIDISKNGIDIAKKNSKRLGFKKGIDFKVSSFPEDDITGEYDLIVCSEVLEHIKDDKAAVAKIFKLLKKGGTFITSVPSQNAPLYRLGLLKEFDRRVGHLRRYTTNSFTNLVNDSGLTVSKCIVTEGLLRNFLFTSSIGGVMLKVLKREPFSTVTTIIDNCTVALFGESDIYIIAIK